MPVLAGIGAADIFAALLEVRQDVDLGVFARRVGLAIAAALNFAELLGEALQRAKVEMLVGKAQHPMAPEREEDLPEIASPQLLRQVDAVHRRAEHRATWFDRQHHALPLPASRAL